eukprot:scaffold465_cov153-Amphora_coffeaeformis.AAC.1
MVLLPRTGTGTLTATLQGGPLFRHGLPTRQLAGGDATICLGTNPTLALWALLMVHLLVGVKSFDGNPAFLDFGWNDGFSLDQQERFENVFADKKEESVDVSSSSLLTEKVIAFSFDYVNYIHVTLGLASALLAFPVVKELLSLPKASPRVSPFLVHVAPLVLSLYPITYQFIALVQASPRTFAASMYSRYALEWTVGFLVGLAVGNVWTTVVLYQRIQGVPCDDHEDGDEESRTERSGGGDSGGGGGSGTASADSDSDSHSTNEEGGTESLSISFSPPWYKFWLADPPPPPTADDFTNDRAFRDAPSDRAHLVHTILGLVYWVSIGLVTVGMGVTWHGSGSDDNTKQ